jgi:TIR domain
MNDDEKRTDATPVVQSPEEGRAGFLTPDEPQGTVPPMDASVGPPREVFLSWQGNHSKAVATALHAWLPLMIHGVEPWMSTHIPAGDVWTKELSGALSAAKCGVICVTHTNKDKPWLQFESGAISKARSSSKAGPADFAYLRRSSSGRWGLWATRRVVQGPVGKLRELVHQARQSPRPSPRLSLPQRSPPRPLARPRAWRPSQG